MAYPNTSPSYTATDANATLAANNHAARHTQEEADIVALAAKVGIGASTPSTATVLKGTGAGTSTYGKVALATEVSGTLPVANGGTGATGSTGSGNVVLATSPTITTPNIASFANAHHDHTNSANGGQLTTDSAPDHTWTSEKLSSTIAFRAYHNTTQSSGNATFAATSFNTESYDLGADFASSEFVVPVSGVYHFDARVHTTSSNTRLIISLFKDTGSGYAEAARGVDHSGTGGAAGQGSIVSSDLKLSAGDKIKVYSFGDSSLNLSGGTEAAYFSGHFIGYAA